MNWDDGGERFFNPDPTLSGVPLPDGQEVVVIDDVLLDPQGLVDWAGRQTFHPPVGFPYPGIGTGAPAGLAARFADYFALRARARLGARRTLKHDVRLSMVTTPPHRLAPCQWQCHRDQVTTDPTIVFIGSVLYLFHDSALGGTSFYTPRQSEAATDRMLQESLTLSPEAFGGRYGLAAGYIGGSNAYFDRVACVPAAWNRMILYDAGFFHTGDIARPDLLTTDPATGRLSLNSFFTCRRTAR
jgi:hypothetical protein